jgi:hypothetical protein
MVGREHGPRKGPLMAPARWKVTVTTEEALEPSDQELDDLLSELAKQRDVDTILSVERAPHGAVQIVVTVEADSSVNAKGKGTGVLAGALQETTIWLRTKYVDKGPIEQAKFASAEAAPA